MKKITNYLKTLLVAALVMVGSNAWADEDWSTVWSADFASAPTGMTYSVTNGSTDITNGYLSYHQGGGSGNRAINTAFTDSKFAVDTNWKMEFDWNCSSSNQNTSNVVFATDQGTAFTMTWASYATAVVVTDASAKELTTTLPILGYNKATCSSWSHIIITGDTENGIYLTITNGETTYVNNVLVTSTFGYPKTFNGSLGRAASHMYIDNAVFQTPKVAGFVAEPTGTVSGVAGTDRKFTLSCLTDGATIYYSESDLEIGAAGWNAYSSEVTTSAETIYIYASDGVANSTKTSFATGAGTAVTLNAPTITLSGIAANGFYYPVVTVASDQSSVELKPTATLTYKFNGENISASSPYTFTTKGTLTVTASADGYTSNSTDYEVTNSYVKVKTIDLAALTASDLSSVWQTSGSAQLPAANWTSRYSNEEFPFYTYNYTSDDAANTNVIPGLVVGISSKDADPGVSPTFYVGAGMILPSMKLNKADLTASSSWNNTINISVDGATEDDIVVYTYPTNYGQSTKTSTLKGNANYGLYRLSDMLTKVDLYSPAPASVSKTISDAGYATFCSPYALDFSGVKGLTAYIAKVVGGNVTFEAVTSVPANTGVLLKGAEGNYEIPVIASADAVENAFVGVTTETANVDAGIYVLMNGTEGVGFYKTKNAFTVGANTAYLPAVASARQFIGFDFDEATAIKAVESVKAENGAFNLRGQRVKNLTKGLYIVNGKKVVK